MGGRALLAASRLLSALTESASLRWRRKEMACTSTVRLRSLVSASTAAVTRRCGSPSSRGSSSSSRAASNSPEPSPSTLVSCACRGHAKNNSATDTEDGAPHELLCPYCFCHGLAEDSN